ncbi:NDR1/HIN1-like protein 13 [Amborella trichopoda]|uniref:Late embryogenesis abundant protein LEA-2 subgroup domain-containing protein n=1 Tax=Amborella trichopoda TaxID=13333 RepID=W1NUR6_AMBTC|nr:NDR1/HIN1-like protein 13 [Amborella trichopoda]ERM99058.1 hypothetical protein AMTR_s00101p00083450 [Amborella trichopoda]|eukprot:XP_006836205.1 NDR1/HIN1-like protein 13 [Amborella trichopoda]
MVDRVYPADYHHNPPETTSTLPENYNMPSAPPESLKPSLESQNSLPGNQNPAPEKKQDPLPGTYIVQVPKDQIYRVPPPENGPHYQRSRKRRSHCCRFLCYFLGSIFALVVLLAAIAGISYLVISPKSPKYSIEKVAIKGFTLGRDLTISPEFDVTVRAENPNKKIGIYYGDKNNVDVFYSDVRLCNGKLPAFYQGHRNVTVFPALLVGSDVRLSTAVNGTLTAQLREGRVPLRLNIDVPVRVKVGAVKSWTVTVRARCDVTVDKLAVDATVLDNRCGVSVKI